MNRDDLNNIGNIYNEGVFSRFFKTDPNVEKYVQQIEQLEKNEHLGRIEASEFFFDKVPSALWKSVLSMYKKRNPDSLTAMYIDSGIGNKGRDLK